MSRIQAYRGNEPYVFISYAHADTEVQDILAELAAKDYRFWYDEGIQSGSDWADVISERIKNCTQFIAFLSDSAVKSENVKDEIHLAVKYKIDMLVIHLENIVLDGGLELHLDRKQALLRYSYESASDFSSRFYQSINKSTKRVVEIGEDTALAKFMQHYDVLKLDALNTFSKTHIAIKKGSTTPVLAKHFGPGGKQEGLDEVRILRMLQDCPFAPFLIETFEDGNSIIIVKTFVQGQYLDQLKDKLDRTDLEAHQDFCVGVALSVAETLVYLHNNPEYPIIHRDIRPANILVNSRGYGIVSDYDLCQVLDDGRYSAIGYRDYAAPERFMSIDSCKIDGRSDIFSLGVCLFEILTGASTGDYNFHDHFILDYNDKFSRALTRIVLKMTQLHPDDRYQTVEELIHDLHHYKEEDAKKRKSHWASELKRSIASISQKRTTLKKNIERKYAELSSIGNGICILHCEGNSQATITLDHNQFLLQEEQRNKGIPEENRLYYEEASAVCFTLSSPIRFDTALTVNFDVKEVRNIRTLAVTINNKRKEIAIKGNSCSVTFKDYPSFLDLSRNDALLKVEGVEFVCTPDHLVDVSIPASLIISDVSIHKA